MSLSLLEKKKLKLKQWLEFKISIKNENEIVKVFLLKFLKNQHHYIIGPRRQTIQEILQETGASVEMFPSKVQSDTVTFRDEPAKLGPALILVHSYLAYEN
ncbi:hypothetical protein NPIL_136691 [Nephila pilipes]|uniref:K Homology domain-containing protein n=1 Tax=Nephila pilipes TaxID=299642 RepID=A0A8X6Q1W3_NEPPI|nr:hypothetical protein NPIL_136691 [Nephila pilipes]